MLIEDVENVVRVLYELDPVEKQKELEQPNNNVSFGMVARTSLILLIISRRTLGQQYLYYTPNIHRVVLHRLPNPITNLKDCISPTR
jgi:hypothetical protein